MRPSIKNVHRELLKNLGEHREYAEDTLRAIDSDIGVFAHYVEETLEKDVDAANVLNRKMLLEFLGGGEISPATKRRRLFSLRLFTAYAVEQDWIDEDPLQGVGIADLLADKERVRPPVLSEEQIEELKKYYGFDKPVFISYFMWLGKILRGDLGTSTRYYDPVWSMIRERIPISLSIRCLPQ